MYLAKDEKVRELFRKMMADGVRVFACKACSDLFGVCTDLENLGVEVKFRGEPLTYILKNNLRVITV